MAPAASNYRSSWTPGGDSVFVAVDHASLPIYWVFWAELWRLGRHNSAQKPYGVPRAGLAKVNRSLRTNGPRFSVTRMVKEYAARVYQPG